MLVPLDIKLSRNCTPVRVSRVPVVPADLENNVHGITTVAAAPHTANDVCSGFTESLAEFSCGIYAEMERRREHFRKNDVSHGTEFLNGVRSDKLWRIRRVLKIDDRVVSGIVFSFNLLWKY